MQINMIFTINMSVDKASGNLTDGETEYRRVK